MIQTVGNTHRHGDHTGNNCWITKKYGLLPLSHPKTSSYMKAPFEWVRFYKSFTRGFPLPSETGLFQQANFLKKLDECFS